MDELTRSVMLAVRDHVDPELAIGLDAPDAHLSRLGLSSLAMVELMLDLETSLAIEFPADMINAETFRSASTIADTIRALRERETR